MPSWLIALDTCPSTSTWALDHLEALAHGAVVWTGRQTAGRGRDGRTWYAPPGVLTASVVLDLPVAPATARPRPPGASSFAAESPLPLAAGLAVAHAVEDACPGLRVALKWPNDCLVDGRKLAGILGESVAGQGARPPRMVVGIGLNIDPRWDLTPDALAFAATRRTTSLAELVQGDLPAMPDLIAGIRRYLLEAAGLISAGSWSQIAPEIAARDALLGRPVTVTDGDRRILGVAAGLDEIGRLRIRTPDQGIVVVAGGHVEDVGPIPVVP